MNRPFWLLLLSSLLIPSLPAGETSEAELSLSVPPASLGRWYKPQNEHNVWLHTMFGLRRAMQAVSEYAALEDRAHLTLWLDRLEKGYRSIGRMVPEWQDELELGLLERMRKADTPEELGLLQRRLARSCEGCHREYRLAARLRYRAPDFDAVRVESEETLEEESYDRVMQRLVRLVNRILIAGGDGRFDAAQQALESLRQRLTDLGGSCSACHGDDPAPRQRILGQAGEHRLEQVAAALATKDATAAGRHLGEFAVGACARCHAIHRPLYQLRKQLSRAQERAEKP